MKGFLIAVLIACMLFIIGFFSGDVLTTVSESILGTPIFFRDLSKAFAPNMAFGSLLSICMLGAYAVSRAYALDRPEAPSALVFLIALLFAYALAGAGIWLNLLELKSHLDAAHGLIPHLGVDSGFLEFFSWGFSPVFWIFGIAFLVLLIGPGRNKSSSGAEA